MGRAGQGRAGQGRAGQEIKADCRWKGSHAAISEVSEAGKELASSAGGRYVLQLAEEHMLQEGIIQKEINSAGRFCTL